MLIEAAGKTWVVEQQELSRSLWGEHERVSEVTFRNLDYATDELSVRWVLSPERLTPRLAEELFELAGTRTWRDPRDSRIYHLVIEANSIPSRSTEPTPVEAVLFKSGGIEVAAPWTLAKPLGWATDSELIRLLDQAVREARSTGIPIG